MKRLLAALTFLLLLFLVWFFWSQGNKEKPITEISEVEDTYVDNDSNVVVEGSEEAPKTIKFKPQRRDVKISLEKTKEEVEVRSDENGVFITKIGDREVNKQVSSFPVQRLTVRSGVMSFWEVNNETKSLKYRSLNLNALVDRMDNQ